MNIMPSTLDRIEYFFHKTNKPTYLGFVAADIGHTIERTQLMCDMLFERGIIRPLTDLEKKSEKINQSHDVWMLVGAALASKGNF